MRTTIVSSFVAVFMLFGATHSTSAEDDGMLIIPVELFACRYNENKGPDNLDKVIGNWNKWADKHKLDDYAAWTLTPFYYGAEQEFDVIWLGAGKDAIALGKAQDAYLKENDGLQAQFNEVLSCDAHANFASINYKAPPKGDTPRDPILTFSDCSIKEGASFEALGTAMGEWSKHMSDAGSNAGLWHWYPVFGGGGETFDFKWIEAHKNLADLGADYESMGNGRGYETYGTLFDELISCDSSRAYITQSRRFVQLR